MPPAERGGLMLMELELIEPYLYPGKGVDFAERFATALEGMAEKAGGPD